MLIIRNKILPILINYYYKVQPISFFCCFKNHPLLRRPLSQYLYNPPLPVSLLYPQVTYKRNQPISIFHVHIIHQFFLISSYPYSIIDSTTVIFLSHISSFASVSLFNIQHSHVLRQTSSGYGPMSNCLWDPQGKGQNKENLL